jgi:hypothetical protein
MRNKLLVAAAVLVGIASVAYAAFATTLSINGTSSIAGNWDVHIDSITPTMGAGTTNNAAATVGSDGLSATFNTDFAYPGATASYDVAITNHGTVNAEVSSIPSVVAINATEPVDIDYQISGPAIGDQLHAGQTVHATVTVQWKAGSVINPSTLSKSATFSYGYIQSPTQP